MDRQVPCLNEKTIERPAANSKLHQGFATDSEPVTKLSEIDDLNLKRWDTGSSELDRVLGGGLVVGSTILLGGDPGIGKSTLLLQVICKLSKNLRALYVTGEESLQQIAMRARRLELNEDQLLLLAETNLEKIIAQLEELKPSIVAIDSIQTIYSLANNATPGGASQIRDCAATLVRFAKRSHMAMFIVGHVTKEGALAGPKILEHMVDSVLYFESETESRYRILRAAKNRFGAVNELGIFVMSDRGLREVSNPSAIFLANPHHLNPGSSTMVLWEGSRALLVEIQALVDESYLANPRRVAGGFDVNRLALLLAVLNRHCHIASYNQDVFVNVVGGIKITETAADLPLLMAIISSLKAKPLPEGLAAFGEIGLAGEIRPVPYGQERIKVAIKQGFKTLVLPKANLPKAATKAPIKLIGITNLKELLASNVF